VATLRTRIEQRDAALFAGRERELATFERLLERSGWSQPSVVFLHGPGGIGKSALAREMARRGRAAGMSIHWIDGRELPPVPDALEDAIGDARRAARPLVVVDDYERIAPVGRYLREAVLPSLPDRALIVVAGRGVPERGWFEGGWEALTADIEVAELSDDDALALVRRRGLSDEEAARRLLAWSRGSPLALSLGVRAVRGDSEWSGPGGSGVLDPMIRRLTDVELRGRHLETLGAAAIARVTTPELLRATVRRADPGEEHAWLASRSFVEPVGGGVAPHDLVSRTVRAELRRVEPHMERELRRRIADHLYERAAETGDLLLVIDLAHLAESPAFRWGFSWEAASRHRVDDPRPGDVAALDARLRDTRHAAMWEASQRFFAEAPEHVAVTRDRADRLSGYSVAVTPATAPAFANESPILGPRLDHARHLTPRGEAVIWADSADLTREPASGVIGLLGMSGVLRTARANPRYGYLPINPLLSGAPEFAAAAGGRHVPELDVVVGDERIECHLIDWGPGGLLAAQRELVYHEAGLEAPPRPHHSSAVTADAVHDALRDLHAPDELARNELAAGDTVEDRAAHVRSLIEDAAGHAFGDGYSELMLRRVLERGYLERGSSHDAAADELDLSRSSYFRRLNRAADRVAEYLARAG
jgi:AAA ATPase domain